MTVTIQEVGTGPGGVPVRAYTLGGQEGIRFTVLSYGATLTSLQAPDRGGRRAEVTLGFDDPAGYYGVHPYFGSTVGRFANRIAGGRFTLDGRAYTLAQNNGVNSLHGGLQGFDKRHWSAEAGAVHGADAVQFRYASADGEEGFPGNLNVTVAYILADAMTLQIEYAALADAPTPVNLTNHAYFNLAGGGRIDDHELRLHADAYLPVDARLIPTGERAPVEGTPFDFRTPRRIGDALTATHAQLTLANGGIDHAFVVNPGSARLAPVASVFEPGSGRTMTLAATQPAVQFYTGNFLDGTVIGHGGLGCARHSGCCLETEDFPDAPNQPGFPSSILRPGALYQHTAVFAFGVR